MEMSKPIPKQVRILRFTATDTGYEVSFPMHPLVSLTCKEIEFLDVTIVRLLPNGEGIAVARVPGNTLYLEYSEAEDKLIVMEVGLEQVHEKKPLRNKFVLVIFFLFFMIKFRFITYL